MPPYPASAPGAVARGGAGIMLFASPVPGAMSLVAPIPEAVLFVASVPEAVLFVASVPRAVLFVAPVPRAVLFVAPVPEAVLFVSWPGLARPPTTSDQYDGQVIPIRIAGDDQSDFPGPRPSLQAGLPLDGGAHVGVGFGIDQTMQFVATGEARSHTFLMLSNAAGQVARHADVERAVRTIGHDVDTTRWHERNDTRRRLRKSLRASRDSGRAKTWVAGPTLPRVLARPAMTQGRRPRHDHDALTQGRRPGHDHDALTQGRGPGHDHDAMTQGRRPGPDHDASRSAVTREMPR
ncbi:MAG: hypothetical protein QOH05_844 [Acetobacteraceae bacterium]|nr:hypothetical protein [Acetobacteraceae bacterium]